MIVSETVAIAIVAGLVIFGCLVFGGQIRLGLGPDSSNLEVKGTSQDERTARPEREDR